MHLAHLSQQIKHIQMEDCVFHYNSELKQSKSLVCFSPLLNFFPCSITVLCKVTTGISPHPPHSQKDIPIIAIILITWI